jgi:hypothetical protein
VGGSVQRSGREDPDVFVRFDFVVGSRVGESESEEDEVVSVRGRLEDINIVI